MSVIGAAKLEPLRELQVAVEVSRSDRGQATAEFKTLYAQRAGIEGTIIQAVHRMNLRHTRYISTWAVVAVKGGEVHRMNLRHTRYIGPARTHLQHLATAAAIDVVRIVAWLIGQKPTATRLSPFLTLMAHA